ncbi:MAG: hypothetical protein HKN07_13475, partial [Acidimicrobiia bacterium]|nr:hypothetical protein [Acidimicrobiia bacterium]
ILEEVIGYFKSVDAGVDLFLPRLFISGKYIELGDVSSALDTRLDLLAWSRETNYPVMIAWSRWNLALALLASGDLEAAAAQTHEAFDQMVFDGYLEGIASGAEVIAIIEIDRGRTERGLQILGACESIWESIGTVHWPEAEFHVKRVLETVRREAEEAQLAVHLETGRQMSTAELIDLVQAALVAQ